MRGEGSLQSEFVPKLELVWKLNRDQIKLNSKFQTKSMMWISFLIGLANLEKVYLKPSDLVCNLSNVIMKENVGSSDNNSIGKMQTLNKHWTDPRVNMDETCF